MQEKGGGGGGGERESNTRVVMHLFADLSECELVHVPDAVYMLMRNTTLEVCNLSANVLRRIPAKLALKFPSLTGSNSAFASLWRGFKIQA